MVREVNLGAPLVFSYSANRVRDTCQPAALTLCSQSRVVMVSNSPMLSLEA